MQSSSIGKIAVALAAVQATLKPAAQDGSNPHFNSKFATLASIWEACRAPLAEQKLSVAQGIDAGTEAGKQAVCWTLLMHESGEWIRSETPLIVIKSDPQGIGSAMTYYRRYGLAAMVGIIQDDDDGNAATGKPSEGKSSQKPAPEKSPLDPAGLISAMEKAKNLKEVQEIYQKAYPNRAKYGKGWEKVDLCKEARKTDFTQASN